MNQDNLIIFNTYASEKDPKKLLSRICYANVTYSSYMTPLGRTVALIVPAQGWESKAWVPAIVLAVTRCVTLRKSLYLPEPQSPPLIRKRSRAYTRLLPVPQHGIYVFKNIYSSAFIYSMIINSFPQV